MNRPPSRTCRPWSRPAGRAGSILLIMVLVLGLAPARRTPAAEADGPASPRIGPLLRRALEDPDAGKRRRDGTFAVWVFFVDRGLEPSELSTAVAAAERALPGRTRTRRAKMAPPGGELADAADLPPAASYLQAVQRTGARLRRPSRWLNAASFEADPDQIAAIAGLACVARLELVAGFRRQEPRVTAAERTATLEARTQSGAGARRDGGIAYGGSLPELAQINVPAVHELGLSGAGVVLGMLDTGWKLTHDAFAGLEVLAAYDFVHDDQEVANEPGEPSGQHNHGTFTLSAIAGFADGALVGPAYGASVLLAKTEDTSQEVPIEEDWWVAGLEWVEAMGADVVSSSLGYYDWYEFADLDGSTAVTTLAADMAVARGVVVVNSAGNSRWGFGHIIAPADGFGVLAIGAVTLDGEFAGFSSPGPTYDGRIKPDVAALGVDNHVVSVTDDQGYVAVSGTSLSCPLVAGVAALILERVPELTPAQVGEALRQTADRAQAPDNDHGWGVVDALAAATYWGALIEHVPLPDTVDTAGPYAVSAAITGRLPLDPARMHVVWRADDAPWQTTPLAAAGGDLWQASLPGQLAGTTVSYYLEATDTADITIREPRAGPTGPHVFLVDSATPSGPPGAVSGSRLIAVLPNPFNPRTTLVYELASTGRARLDIVDLRGRRVRALLAAEVQAGRHRTLWDGLDDAGRAVPAGVYLARLATDDGAHLQKMTLVR